MHLKYTEYIFKVLLLCISPCNTENPAKWLFVTPYKSTMNQLVEEVVVTATSQCRTLSLCGSYTVLFGMSKQLNLNRKQGHQDVSKLFLIKLKFRFSMFDQYLTSKQQLTSSYLAPSSAIQRDWSELSFGRVT